MKESENLQLKDLTEEKIDMQKSFISDLEETGERILIRKKS